jgi:hypothetical protein
MPTCKELWREAKKKNPPSIKPKQYILVWVSAAVGAIVSTLLSKIDFNTAKSLTGYPFWDLIIYGLILAVLVTFILGILFRLGEFSNTIQDFFSLLWKKKEIKKKNKK